MKGFTMALPVHDKIKPKFLVFLTLALAFALTGWAKNISADDSKPAQPQKGPRVSDTETLDSTLKALYDVISGPKGPRDWDRFRNLFAPGARLIPCARTRDGLKQARVLTPDQFVEFVSKATETEGFYEQETGRKVDQYGSIAQVFSNYESRHDLKGDPFAKGVNSIQLLNDGKRWWVVTIFWDQEAPKPQSKTDQASLEIFFIDVMGGAATLIVTPERESILIDSGWPGLEDRDPKRIVHVLKDVAKLDHLDHLVTTHWHTDHYGGVKGLANLIRIDHYWDRGLPNPEESDSPKPTDALMSAYLKASEGKRQTLKPGDRLPLKGNIEWLTLASSGQVIANDSTAPDNPLAADAPPDQKPDPSDNARSVTFKLSLGQFDFLDCGDLTWNVERQLVCPKNRIGQIDLYQVTHHGMSISNYPTLIETINPIVAITNNGPRKGGAPETLKRLQAVKSIQAIYQLHRNQASKDQENVAPEWIANTKPEGGQFVRVTVNPDGSKFDVRFGADGPAKSYATVK